MPARGVWGPRGTSAWISLVRWVSAPLVFQNVTATQSQCPVAIWYGDPAPPHSPDLPPLSFPLLSIHPFPWSPYSFNRVQRAIDRKSASSSQALLSRHSGLICKADMIMLQSCGVDLVPRR